MSMCSSRLTGVGSTVISVSRHPGNPLASYGWIGHHYGDAVVFNSSTRRRILFRRLGVLAYSLRFEHLIEGRCQRKPRDFPVTPTRRCRRETHMCRWCSLKALPELTPRSVGWGLLLCILFTIASAYSGLKVGQVMEAAIPISILAIGLARVFPRRSSVLENVIITGIGGSGRVGGGRSHLQPSGSLHIEARPASGSNHLHLSGGRVSWRTVSHPAAALFRARDARPVPLS